MAGGKSLVRMEAGQVLVLAQSPIATKTNAAKLHRKVFACANYKRKKSYSRYTVEIVQPRRKLQSNRQIMNPKPVPVRIRRK